jgi:hypothetical protein
MVRILKQKDRIGFSCLVMFLFPPLNFFLIFPCSPIMLALIFFHSSFIFFSMAKHKEIKEDLARGSSDRKVSIKKYGATDHSIVKNSREVTNCNVICYQSNTKICHLWLRCSYRNKVMIFLTSVFFLICYAAMTALILRRGLLITPGHKYHIHCF